MNLTIPPHVQSLLLWVLPCLSAVFFILALPPIGISFFALVALVPLLFFASYVATPLQSGIGWGIFAAVYVGYITYSVILGFHWIAEAQLFISFVYGAGSLAALCIVALVAFVGFAAVYVGEWLVNRVGCTRIQAVTLLAGFVALAADYTLYTYMGGFNFGALFFAGQHVTYLRDFIDLGHPIMISLAVVLSNVALFTVAMFILQKVTLRSLLTVVVPVTAYLIIPVFIADTPVTMAAPQSTVTMAIIQDAARAEDEAFGVVEEGRFTFPELEAHLASITDTSVEYIIYPFAPWNGVMGTLSDNARFDRTVVTIDEELFGTWLREHVPEGVVFMTWFTTLEQGKFYNQIVLYRDGERIGTYNKRHLFPFFDYTPAWALALGIVSLPYDGTPGADVQEPLVVDGVRFGGLVCSEIGDDTATRLSVAQSNVLLSIGSESMFTHQVPGEYNALRAQQSAEKFNVPVVRANKFGPSVVYDGNGQLIARMEYEETGVMITQVPLVEPVVLLGE